MELNDLQENSNQMSPSVNSTPALQTKLSSGLHNIFRHGLTLIEQWIKIEMAYHRPQKVTKMRCFSQLFKKVFLRSNIVWGDQTKASPLNSLTGLPKLHQLGHGHHDNDGTHSPIPPLDHEAGLGWEEASFHTDVCRRQENPGAGEPLVIQLGHHNFFCPSYIWICAQSIQSHQLA